MVTSESEAGFSAGSSFVASGRKKYQTSRAPFVLSSTPDNRDDTEANDSGTCSGSGVSTRRNGPTPAIAHVLTGAVTSYVRRCFAVLVDV